MSDLSTWNQKLLAIQTGIRAGAPAVQGLQEAKITKVGTAMLSLDGGPATSYDCVWFYLPNTMGPEAGFGPAPYEVAKVTVAAGAFGTISGTEIPAAPITLSANTPQVGDIALVGFVGNGTGRPYVIAFLTPH